jgi:hypothetical protein
MQSQRQDEAWLESLEYIHKVLEWRIEGPGVCSNVPEVVGDHKTNVELEAPVGVTSNRVALVVPSIANFTVAPPMGWPLIGLLPPPTRVDVSGARAREGRAKRFLARVVQFRIAASLALHISIPSTRLGRHDFRAVHREQWTGADHVGPK